MSDDKPTPPPDDTKKPAEQKLSLNDLERTAKGETEDEGKPAEVKPAADKPAEVKPKLSDEEKAAKIAAAKAKAAAKKAEGADTKEGDEGPKDPWEDKPVPPTHEEAGDDPDVTALADKVEGSVVAADRFAGDITVTVPSDKILDCCRVLKNEQSYTFLVDLTAVDWPEREEGRFDVVYWLHRFDDSKRLRLRAVVGEGEPVATVTGVWRTANWLEREVWDMFGIIFDGHPNLERILTWEGFNGHPLRKDFPVEGIDTGAAIYPEVYPPGGGPVVEEAGEGGEA